MFVIASARLRCTGTGLHNISNRITYSGLSRQRNQTQIQTLAHQKSKTETIGSRFICICICHREIHRCGAIEYVPEDYSYICTSKWHRCGAYHHARRHRCLLIGRYDLQSLRNARTRFCRSGPSVRLRLVRFPNSPMLVRTAPATLAGAVLAKTVGPNDRTTKDHCSLTQVRQLLLQMHPSRC